MKWRVLWLMTGTQASASVVQQALGSLSPALVATFGLTKAQLGVVFTSMMLGSALFVAVAGLLVDRWGERHVVLGAGIFMALALLIPLVAPTYPGLIAGIGLFGAIYASATPAGGRAILAWFDRDRGFAMGIRQTGVPIGGTVGALTLPPLAHTLGLRAAFLYGALAALVPAIVAYVTLPGAKSDRGTSPSLGTLLRGMRALASDRRLIGVALTCMTLVSIQQALNAFLTVTAVGVIGTTATVAAFALALAQCCAAAGRLWWGFASDRLFGGDRMMPFALICAISGITAGWIGYLGHGAVGALFVAAAVIGLTGVGWNGLMAAALAEIGGADRAASALGLALTAVFTASTIAPVGFGTIADRFSLRVAWLVIGAVALLGMGPALWLRSVSAKRVAVRPG